MTRLPLVDPTTATGPASELLGQVKKGMGMVPNMTKAMANSPATLKAYLQLSGALAGGVLDAKTRERIALTMAQANECDYCLSAHTAMAPHYKLSTDEVLQARSGAADDAKTDAILKFVRAVADRGDVTDEQVAAVRAAGVTDEEIAEIVANVALNTLTNYFNKVAGVEIEFPRVRANELALV